MAGNRLRTVPHPEEPPTGRANARPMTGSAASRRMGQAYLHPSRRGQAAAPQDEGPWVGLLRTKPFGECLDTDKAAGVAALADAAFVVEGLDFEADQPALHRDHPRRGAYPRADRGCGEMADVDLGADRDPARFEARLDGTARGEFHFQNHHRRRIDHRHDW